MDTEERKRMRELIARLRDGKQPKPDARVQMAGRESRARSHQELISRNQGSSGGS